MAKMVSEILDEVKKAPTEEAKIAVLRCNITQDLLTVLKGVFCPGIRWFNKIPLYTPSDAPVGLGLTNLTQEIKLSYLFQPNHPKNLQKLPEKRLQIILLQVLEALEAKEAEVFCGMLRKDLKIPGFTRDLVEQAFPGLTQ